MTSAKQLHTAILEKLKTVIDPETGVNVIRMRRIEDLTVSDAGHVAYKFHPPQRCARWPYRWLPKFSAP